MDISFEKTDPHRSDISSRKTKPMAFQQRAKLIAAAILAIASSTIASSISFTADFSQTATLNIPLLDSVGSGHGSLGLCVLRAPPAELQGLELQGLELELQAPCTEPTNAHPNSQP